MKTEIALLPQIKLNATNPRHITDDKFKKLVDSILVLPKMLEIRPIAVDERMVALGGNMRHRALTFIQGMPVDEISSRMAESSSFQKKTIAEKQSLLNYWTEWQKSPKVLIVRADNLSEEEKREFIIKDNVSYGSWDYDELANTWDENELLDWGMDVWAHKEETDPAIIYQGDAEHDDDDDEIQSDIDESQEAHVRMVQLFFNDDSFNQFTDDIRHLKDLFNAENVTQAVQMAVKYARDNH